MANIHDIARLSGYSVSTVSRVLNQSGYVSAIARAEIQQVIDQLDYAPNALARDLSKGKSRNIGVVVANLSHPYYTLLLTSIMEEAFAADYNVVILKSDYDPNNEKKYLEQLHRKAYDALIFTSHGMSLEELAAYQKYGPIVCCQDTKGIDIAAAYTTRHQSYLEAFSWIKNSGYRHICIFSSRPSPHSATTHATMIAYQEVFGHLPADNLLYTGIHTDELAYQVTPKTLSLEPKPDFYFCNSDDIAAGVYRYFTNQKLPVPPLLGQENQLSGMLLNIPTIDHHLDKVGQNALHLAISGEIKQISVASEFILRQQD